MALMQQLTQLADDMHRLRRSDCERLDASITHAQ
jgi:hypothetical protein